MKWYNKQWFMWLMLFIFAPLGIFLMWKNKRYNKTARIVLTVIFAIFFIAIVASPGNNEDKLASKEGQPIEKTVEQPVEEKAVEQKPSAQEQTAKVNNDQKAKAEAEKQTEIDTEKYSELEPVKNNDQPTIVGDKISVHFIDVGQGDSIFIDAGDYDILIDAGNNSYGSAVTNYLNQLGTDDIELLVSTHPHADHVGGLDDVLKAFNVEKVIYSGHSSDTKTYKDYWSAVQAEKCLVLEDNELSYDLFDGAVFKVIETGDKWSNTNNYSVVCTLDYNDTEFLFTGDMEKEAEQAALNKFFDIELLKVGHHGSHSSTSQQFLNVVKPEFAVISCGDNNKYGHPHAETLNKLVAENVQIFRTDEQGTIIVVTDGNTITFNKKASAIKPQAPPANTDKSEDNNISKETGLSDKDIIVYVTGSGKKYHVESCSYLSKSKIPIKLLEAKEQGYEPCSRCKPPKD